MDEKSNAKKRIEGIANNIISGIASHYIIIGIGALTCVIGTIFGLLIENRNNVSALEGLMIAAITDMSRSNNQSIIPTIADAPLVTQTPYEPATTTMPANLIVSGIEISYCPHCSSELMARFVGDADFTYVFALLDRSFEGGKEAAISRFGIHYGGEMRGLEPRIISDLWVSDDNVLLPLGIYNPLTNGETANLIAILIPQANGRVGESPVDVNDMNSFNLDGVEVYTINRNFDVERLMLRRFPKEA